MKWLAVEFGQFTLEFLTERWFGLVAPAHKPRTPIIKTRPSWVDQGVKSQKPSKMITIRGPSHTKECRLYFLVFRLRVTQMRGEATINDQPISAAMPNSAIRAIGTLWGGV